MRYLLIALFILTNTFAYTPTIESLFRNGDNDTVDGYTISANFVMTRKTSVLQSSETLKELPSVYSYKLVFNNDVKKPSQFIQLAYSGNVISSSSLFDLKYFPQMTFNSLKLSAEDNEKKLFYSLIHSLVNNNGALMIDFLNSVGLSALKNTERVNREQIQLISKYISYLKQKKNDPDLEIENPLEPSNPEEKNLVREILKKPFLTNSPYVKRTRENNKVYYSINSEGVEIKFDAEKHELLSIKIKTSNGTLEAKCFNYLVYSTVNRKLKFPQLILLRDFEGNEYELEMKKLRAVSENLDGFIKRLQKYKKDVENGLNQEMLGKSSFIL